MVVWLDAKVDGNFARTVAVPFRVHAYRDAWVAPSAIGSGAPLTADRVKKREVDITRTPVAPLLATESQMPGQWQTTRAIRSGEVVTMRNAAPAPLVARGEWVALHLKSGGVELEGRAQALQDGELGQMVKVRSANRADPMTARIVAPGRVEAML